MSGKGVEIVTFGCRLNTYESEVIRREAGKAGLENAIVVNTCAVTAEATRQARQTIRKLKRENPDARILVTGCAAQVEPEIFAEMAEVDAVLGNEEKLHAETYRALPFGLDAQEKVRVNDIMSVRETAGHLLDAQPHEGFGGRARAYLQVQNGCDHRCTFCIIPFGRGPSRSVPMGSVVEEVRRLAENGFREVVITGVDITSYGHDLPGNPRLGDLVQAVLHHVPELPRLRLSSIDSVEADPALLDALASASRLMPHLHLSLQAGHDLTLKRMKRRHLREDAIRFCEEVRARRPDIVFGADLIAGFPTETEEMFEGTLSIVEACDLTHLHVFPFSPRPGTPAARMPQVPRAEIKARAERLRAAGAVALTRHLEAERGRTALVLSERSNFGRTEGFTPVRLENAVAGEVLPVRIAGHDGETLVAERIKEAA